jgi:hypothetical protein
VNSTETDEITAYVEAVRAALSGLPEAMREELLEDLPEHLAEVVADEVGTLTERLGPPSVYAAELLAGAGFVGGGFPDPPPPSRTDHLAKLRSAWAARLRVIDGKTGPFFGYARASEFLRLLRPAWWVLRGYLIAMVIAHGLDASGSIGLLPRVGGSDLIALLLLTACVLPSIWFGRRGFNLARGPRLAYYAGSALLILIAVAGFTDADSQNRQDYYNNVEYSDPYSNVRDVFVYDQQGRLVDGARLFDQDGQPIRLGQAYCEEFDGPAPQVVDDSKYPFCGADKAPFKLTDPSAAPVPSPSK